MNYVELYFCKRCHSVLRSETYEVRQDRPRVLYKPPARCNICKDNNYFDDTVNMQALPNEGNGLLCQCQDPDCGKTFYARPSWYKKQQAVKNTDLLKWMPVLIDPDKDKVQRLLNGTQEELTRQ